MPAYSVPSPSSPHKVGRKQVLLVANGDLRLSANQVCWPAQKAMEDQLTRAVESAGHKLVRAHPYKPHQNHGFIILAFRPG